MHPRLKRRALYAVFATLPGQALAKRRHNRGTAENTGIPFDDPFLPRATGGHFRMSNAEILEAFLDAALGMDREGADRRFQPWRGTMRPLLLQPVSDGTRQVIANLMAWTVAAGGLHVEAPIGGEANLAILVTGDPVEALTGPEWPRAGRLFYADRDTLRAELSPNRACFGLAQNHSGTAVIATRTDHPGEVLRCMSRMLLAVLGFRGGLSPRMPSVMADGPVLVEPTPLDRLLLALAYDPALVAGMTEGDLRAVLPDRIEALRSWSGFDALAPGIGQVEPFHDGDRFEPTAARALRAFAEIAVPAIGETPRLMRWDADAVVPIHVRGRAGPVERAAIGWVCDWASASTGLDLRFAETRQDEGITLMLGSTLEGLWGQEGPALHAHLANDRTAYDRLIGNPLTAVQGGVTLLHHTVPGSSIRRALALVATDAPPGIVVRRIARELLRSLGMRGDGSGIGHSLFDVRSVAFQPTALDDRVLRMMYGARLAPGLPRDQSIRLAESEMRGASDGE